MADTTTVKVATSTRDLINSRASALGQTADQVVQDGLRALDREARRAQMREESLAIRDDPAELAEITAIREDLHVPG